MRHLPQKIKVLAQRTPPGNREVQTLDTTQKIYISEFLLFLDRTKELDLYYLLFCEGVIVDFFPGMLKIYLPSSKTKLATSDILDSMKKKLKIWYYSHYNVATAWTFDIIQQWDQDIPPIPLKDKLTQEILNSDTWKYLNDNFKTVKIEAVVPTHLC